MPLISLIGVNLGTGVLLFHRKLEQEPFLRIRRKIHVSVDFRAVKFNNFYWPEMQNVICSLETDTKFHHVP